MSEQTQELVDELRKKEAIVHATKRCFESDDGKVVLDYFLTTNCVVEKFIKDPIENAWAQSRRAFVLEIAATVYGPNFFAQRIKTLLTPTDEPDQPFIT